MFSKASLLIGDSIFELLENKISELQRKQSKTVCRLFQKGLPGFAYIYHEIAGAAVTIWCLGEPDELKEAAKGSSLLIRPRDKQTGSWAEKFKCRFKVEDKEEVEAAANILYQISFPYTLKKSSASQSKAIVQPLAEEISPKVDYPEGAAIQLLVNSYERNPEAREDCIKIYGAKCFVCDFDFGEKYGEIGDGFIHVHHLKPISAIGKQYQINPRTDLRPVCPNCHAMLHRKSPPFSIEEIKSRLK
ncbi:MAG: HNH endonuclease [Cyanobacteriota bacterium]